MIDAFIQQAQDICGAPNVWTDPLRCLTYGTDASFYRYLPKAVVKAANEGQVSQLLAAANKLKVPVTFRAGGTSLSGQTLSDSVIIQTQREDWRQYSIQPNGLSIRMQVGLRGGEVNALLKPFGRMIGPDPASINSAMIGGIVANNASGMRAGIDYNAYLTLESIRVVLADGTVLDTSSHTSRELFAQSHADLLARLLDMRQRVLQRPDWVDKIRSKYELKNTIGYGLNSLIDFADPIDILAHLLVGSEGTIGFISQVSLQTVEDKPFNATGLLLFAQLEDACRAAIRINARKATAIELIDRKALQAVEGMDGVPAHIALLPDQATALLVELTANSDHELQAQKQAVLADLEAFVPAHPFEFTEKPKEIAKLWKVRKGIFPSVGANRKPGTTVFIEDVAFRLEQLPAALRDLRQLIADYGFDDGVIYGHANDGNVHFIFSEDMSQAARVENYDRFMHALVHLVIDRYNGSLKAEHGTGRNMAPFVAYEWGSELYAFHREIKQLLDPNQILNPGVMINDDPQVHIRHIKQMPQADSLIDNCIECGFCELNCLTNELNLSARQRIVSFREITRLQQAGAPAAAWQPLQAAFQQHGIDTCAGDGLCATSCPVGIDTGQIVKKLRGQQTTALQHKVANSIADNMGLTTSAVKLALGATNLVHKVVGTPGLKSISQGVNKLSGGLVPTWNEHFPKPNTLHQPIAVPADAPKVVYFPSCISQTMGLAAESNERESQTDVALRLLAKAGYQVVYPDNMSKLCCGTPWESKGFVETADRKSAELETALLKASNNGQYPVLFDTSPCLYRMKKAMKSNLRLWEPIEFSLDFLVDKLTLHPLPERVALHSTCTTTKLGLAEKLQTLGSLCAQEAVVPRNVGCCGFAGDKGFTQPEINGWALRDLHDQTHECSAGYSNSRTCEIGLSTHSGIEYKSIFYLVDRASETPNKTIENLSAHEIDTPTHA